MAAERGTSMMIRKLIWLAATAALSCASAAAQSTLPATPVQITAPPSDAAKALVGAWEMSNAERDKVCTLTLKGDPGQGGFKLEPGRNCATVFPVAREMATWTLSATDVLRLLDARGKPLLEFSEVESGMYEGERPGEGLYFLQSVAAAAAVKTADQMFGEWAVTRGAGKPICGITLTNTAAGQDSYMLRVKPGCDALVTRFNPLSWKVERGELILEAARGQAWRFEESDSTTWQRVPAPADPILLVKQ
jgi:hypothetical protein